MFDKFEYYKNRLDIVIDELERLGCMDECNEEYNSLRILVQSLEVKREKLQRER